MTTCIKCGAALGDGTSGMLCATCVALPYEIRAGIPAITPRDLFAAAALSRIVYNATVYPTAEAIACAWDWADAMLAARR